MIGFLYLLYYGVPFGSKLSRQNLSNLYVHGIVPCISGTVTLVSGTVTLR